MFLLLDCNLSDASGDTFVKALERMMPSDAGFHTVRLAQANGADWKDEVKAGRYTGIVVSGSGACPEDDTPWVQQFALDMREVTAWGVPTFGLCFGHQLLAHAWGGKVEQKVLGYKIRDICDVEVNDWEGATPVFADSSQATLEVLSSHQDQVVQAPEGWSVVASSDRCPIQALRAPELPILSVQWHPEADEGFILDNPHPDWERIDASRLTTLSGSRILREFLGENQA